METKHQSSLRSLSISVFLCCLHGGSAPGSVRVATHTPLCPRVLLAGLLPSLLPAGGREDAILEPPGVTILTHVGLQLPRLPCLRLQHVCSPTIPAGHSRTYVACDDDSMCGLSLWVSCINHNGSSCCPMLLRPLPSNAHMRGVSAKMMNPNLTSAHKLLPLSDPWPTSYLPPKPIPTIFHSPPRRLSVSYKACRVITATLVDPITRQSEITCVSTLRPPQQPAVKQAPSPF